MREVMGIGNRGTEIVRFSKIDNYNVFERLPRERERGDTDVKARKNAPRYIKREKESI